jgi:hypothetical protein
LMPRVRTVSWDCGRLDVVWCSSSTDGLKYPSNSRCCPEEPQGPSFGHGELPGSLTPSVRAIIVTYPRYPVLSQIALGGTIGTGLFVGSGNALATAGPVGAWLAYSTLGALES